MLDNPIWSFAQTELEIAATDILKVVISHLLQEGKIDELTANDYLMNYAILVRKPSFFNKLWDKIFKKYGVDPLAERYVLVRQCTIRVPTGKGNDETKKPTNGSLKVVQLKKDKKSDEHGELEEDPGPDPKPVC